MQKIIQIHPCLLKLSRKQESVTDGLTDRQTDGRPLLLYLSPLSRGGGGKNKRAWSLGIRKDKQFLLY
jgi:hypothetical protein